MPLDNGNSTLEMIFKMLTIQTPVLTFKKYLTLRTILIVKITKTPLDFEAQKMTPNF